MTFDSWEMFSSSEKELFQRCCRRLLKTTFVVRDRDEDSKKLYFFISKNENTFSEYLGFMGFDIVVDKDNGVVMLTNDGGATESGKIQANRLKLKINESIVLCCLWVLYLDRIKLGSLQKKISVSVFDLRNELEKYGLKDEFDGKTTMGDILKLFSKFSLIDIAGKVGEPDCKIVIYPSIQFALDMDRFQEFVIEANEKMKKRNDSDSDEDEEADDFEN